MKRRDCLRRSAAAAAVLGFPMVITPEVLGAARRPGPNDRLQVGFIGLGGRARWILKNEGLPGAEVVAAADCYLTRANEAAQQVAGGDKWRKYQHYCEMLEKEKLDAVFVETTTHARVLICSHLVNICRALQRRLHWNPQKEQFVGDEEANGLLSRPRRRGYELPTI
jgi:hypothetical protein